MTIASWTFASFLALVFAAFRLTPTRARPLVLLVASVLFYAWAFPAHALLLAALTLATWLIGNRLVESPRRGVLLGLGVGALLIALGVFKYADMATQTASWLLGMAGLEPLLLPRIVAPLGLSYATFMLIHYLAEVYRGHSEPCESFLDFALYAFFFPTIVSGPIKRYPDFETDLALLGAPIDPDGLAQGVWRIAIGLFKKLVLAELLVVWTVPLLDRPAQQEPLALLVAVYAYAFVIYFDFAGYSDIAIGVSRLFGFRIIENFNRPYLRENLSQFWRGWHISLTRFIAENVYIPLGGSRRGRFRTALNTMVAMVLSGLWHGAAWHFVAWGALHGIGLIAWRVWRKTYERVRASVPAIASFAENPAGALAGRVTGVILTFNFVAFAWVAFLLPLPDALVVWERIARALYGTVRHLVGV